MITNSHQNENRNKKHADKILTSLYRCRFSAETDLPVSQINRNSSPRMQPIDDWWRIRCSELQLGGSSIGRWAPDILQCIKADWSITEEKAITGCIAREIVTSIYFGVVGFCFFVFWLCNWVLSMKTALLSAKLRSRVERKRLYGIMFLSQKQTSHIYIQANLSILYMYYVLLFSGTSRQFLCLSYVLKLTCTGTGTYHRF